MGVPILKIVVHERRVVEQLDPHGHGHRILDLSSPIGVDPQRDERPKSLAAGPEVGSGHGHEVIVLKRSTQSGVHRLLDPVIELLVYGCERANHPVTSSPLPGQPTSRRRQPTSSAA